MNCSPFLRVSVVPTKDMKIHRNEDGSFKLSGIQGRFLGTVLEAMKMPFQLVIPEDREWGRLLPSGNWTGMIGMIEKGDADIADSCIGVTEQRATAVDFSPVYLTDDMTFAIKKPGPVPTSSAFVHPFDFITWTLILTVLLVMPLIFQYIFRYQETYIFSFLRFLGSLFRQHTLVNYDTKGFKSLIFSWWFFVTVASFSYSAVLLSVLSIPSEVVAVQNFIELSMAVKNNGYRCYVPKGTAALDFMLNNNKDHLRYLGESAFRRNWYTNGLPLTSTDQIDYRSALIDPRTRLLFFAGPEEWKPHFLSDDSLIAFKFAIAMNKNFCYKKKLNTIISGINSAGLYMQFTKEEHFKSWLSASERRRDVSKKIKPLSFEDLFGGFVVLLVGLNFGIITLVYELICHRIKRKCCWLFQCLIHKN